jgi:ABC-2 type transport system permease protein
MRSGVPAVSLEPQTGLHATTRRIGAMVLRHWYLLRSSGPRVLEMVFWPLVQMLTWGFVQVHLAQTTSLAATAAGLFVGGVLLWDILARSQLGLAMAFLEEVWARNLGHLMMSPLRPVELIASLIVVSLMKLLLTMIPVVAIAYLMFDYNLFGLGLALAAFFANLVVTSWSFGLVSTGAVLRYGLGAENIAWLMTFLMMPLACVYYPVTTLPVWLQPFAWALPPTHVFEGLRAVVLHGEFRADLMLSAMALNVIYLVLGVALFRYLIDSARRAGTLVQMGE